MSRWTRTATGSTAGSMVADAAEVRRAVALFADPEHGFEVMSLKSGIHRTLPGSSIDAITQAVEELPDGIGIYFRINPVPVTLHKAAANGNIISRRWFYIDVDPFKPAEFKNDPATLNEKIKTGEVTDAINEHLRELGWPNPIVTDSGNGYNLFWRCELQNDRLTQLTYQNVLNTLSAKFSGPNGTVDKSIHNAARLAKLPGTWARKGTEHPGREHRPCKLLVVPDQLEHVTFEMLQAACAKPGTKQEQPREPPPSSNGTYSHARDATQEERRNSSYGRKALDSECVRIALSRSGGTGGTGRNNAVRDGAFRMGQLLAGGALTDREFVSDRLFDAANRNGITDDDGPETIRDLIRRSIDAGIKSQARSAPEQPPDPKVTWGKQQDGKPQDSEPSGRKPLTIKLSDIKPQQVEWLIRHRIPNRFITVFAGRTGVGKSFVTHDLIARLSTGGEIPFSGGECFDPAGTLIISEDSHEFVLVPRLIEAGADLSKIHAMTWESMAKYHLGDTDMLSQACDEVGGAKVVVIDPPTNFLMDTDEHKNSDVRQLVMRVVEWALSRDVAVIFILHVNKQTGKGIEALNRVMGSVAWVTTARIAHTFCADPNDSERSLWVPLKNNLGPIAKALAYRVTPTENDMARVEWIEEVDMSADEAMGHAAAAPKRRSVIAAVWLSQLFADVDKLPSNTIYKTAEKTTTLSPNALKEAKEEMGIKARQEYDDEGNRAWVWYWPKQARDEWNSRDEKSE